MQRVIIGFLIEGDSYALLSKGHYSHSIVEGGFEDMS